MLLGGQSLETERWGLFGELSKSDHAVTKEASGSPGGGFWPEWVSRTGLGVPGDPDRCTKLWQAIPRGSLCSGVHGAAVDLRSITAPSCPRPAPGSGRREFVEGRSK